MFSQNNLLTSAVLLSSLILLSACQSSKRNQIDFETPGVKSTADRLVIPPDITGISSEDKYKLPNGAVRASEYNKQNQGNQKQKVLPKIEGVYIERAGNQRWLVVKNKNPTELWPTLYSFWQNMGFVINKEEKTTGFMETQWAENRANIPGDPIRDFLTNIGLGAVYSSSIRDKFIIHVEPYEENGSIVTFTNKKREEVFVGRDKNTTKWIPKPSDRNLEAQFLARYMLSLGYDKEAVIKELNKSQQNLLASINGKSLILKGEHNRNKYRLKLALNRIGLTVLNYNKESDTLVVSPALDNKVDEEKSGFLTKIFGKNNRKKNNSKQKNAIREKIHVTIKPQDSNNDVVRIFDEKGNPHAKQDIIINKLFLELR